MKKPIPFLLLILLAALSFAQESQTQLFSGMVLTDEVKETGDHNFKFAYSYLNDNSFVETPINNLIISTGECKKNTLFNICINKVNFSHDDNSTLTPVYELDVTIYKFDNKISVSGKIAPSSLLQNELGNIEIMISNPTSVDMASVLYSIDLSPMTLVDLSGCKWTGTHLTWQGTIRKGNEVICAAKISGSGEGSHSFGANLSYYNGLDTVQETPSALSVEILPKQIMVTTSVDEEIELKKPFYYNLTLENTNSENDIRVTLSVKFPKNFEQKGILGEFDRTTNTLRRILNLAPGDTASYSIYLEATSAPKAPVEQKYDYTITNLRNSIINNTFLNVIDPKPELNITVEYPVLIPGVKFITLGKVTNPSKFHEVTDIEIILDATNHDRITSNFEKLLPQESLNLLSQSLVTPGNKDSMELNVRVAYNIFDTRKSFTKIIIIPINHSSSNYPDFTGSTDQEIQLNSSESQAPQPTNQATSEGSVGEVSYGKSSEMEIEPSIQETGNLDPSFLDLIDKKTIFLVSWIFILVFMAPGLYFYIKRKKLEEVEYADINPERTLPQKEKKPKN